MMSALSLLYVFSKYNELSAFLYLKLIIFVYLDDCWARVAASGSAVLLWQAVD